MNFLSKGELLVSGSLAQLSLDTRVILHLHDRRRKRKLVSIILEILWVCWPGTVFFWFSIPLESKKAWGDHATALGQDISGSFWRPTFKLTGPYKGQTLLTLLVLPPTLMANQATPPRATYSPYEK